ncbi:MMPL family transporter [Alkalicoccus urumqiensis]|uniref:SSD domain-containing protein n=1 Tax=Alkalicoccus urumqiensis TaxID=1548213 RepID=A0A2P6MF92_ALKUR|nr:MMPL family transporter [Alkalicoccus urumqiensis]PRO64944.1 hypothetical protein C6I21_12435 [Alkalicoccus urumqiensis]
MKRLLYILPVIWAALGVFLFLESPDMETLVRERGQFDIPEEYQTARADQILEEHGASSGEDILLVYTAEEAFSSQQKEELEEVLDGFPEEIEGYPVESIASPFDNGGEALISESGDVYMAVVTMDMTVNDVPYVREDLEAAAQAETVTTYVSGSAVIEDDVILSSEEGLQTTTVITVVFVVGILLIVFRSVTAPLVPLLTVGAAYIMTMPLVSYLIDVWDFPVSNFTQIFIVAILFGIGTDYCILLMNRFKEELAVQPDRVQAVVTTFRAVGPTVLSSAFTGFIGFAAIGLADFDLYQSAVGVAVGILFLLGAIAVWVPPAMLLFGDRLFWPSRRALEATDSRIWKGLGAFSFMRPGWTALLILFMLIPAFLFYDQRLSFHSLDEISSDTASVQAVEIVSDAFGEGASFPLTVLLTGEDPVDSSDMLQLTEDVSAQLMRLEEVEEVRSPLRPDGSPIEELLLTEVLQEAADGAAETADGTEELRTGLTEASEELENQAESLETASEETQAIPDNGAEIAESLNDISGSLNESAEQAENIAAAQQTLAAGLEQNGLAGPAQSLRETTAGLEQLQAGLQQIAQGTGETAAGQAQLAEESRSIPDTFSETAAGFRDTAAELNEAASGLEEIEDGIRDITGVIEDTADLPAADTTFYLTEEVTEDEDVQDALSAFTTEDRQVMQIDVVLGIDPYSSEAMNVVDTVEEQTELITAPYNLETAVSGLPAVNADLSQISDEDFFRTAVIMLTGIFIILIIMLRSMIMPAYILVSLIGTYIMSMAVTEFIFITILGYPGISWAVPFFGFVMLMALGVDYSIFLMARFAENMRTQPVKEALLDAMTKIGTVILSAAVILAGTFGAMMPSGVLSLVQIGTLVLTGLLLYALVMLPMFIPLMVRVFGEKSWLPFQPPKEK